MPRPILRDYSKWIANDGKVMRFAARMLGPLLNHFDGDRRWVWAGGEGANGQVQSCCRVAQPNGNGCMDGRLAIEVDCPFCKIFPRCTPKVWHSEAVRLKHIHAHRITVHSLCEVLISTICLPLMIYKVCDIVLFGGRHGFGV